ncbi:RNA-guided endonuclease InsQ/TnpB family protein [Nonomuraea glycinis]|uniref:RNA-guided endonuclease InsQ/TnpB family protein n=1 Tax=Nonomuraea glycinis TaxID=2047744 RepID=UPI002E14BC90|nr:RNA-guided endonuclease TnpB family protein [Nonomuraea glycinis]
MRLLPTPEQAAALEATLRAVNRAANEVSEIAFARKIHAGRDLRRVVYGQVRAAFGLGSQPAQHTIKKVADAYTALRANLRNGTYGPANSPRRLKAESKPISFRPLAAQPFDDRCLSWDHDAQTISIWTSSGRAKNVAFTGSAGQLARLREHRRGESDLLSRDGMWFLLATIEIPDPPLREPAGFLGVDLGIANIATTCPATPPAAAATATPAAGAGLGAARYSGAKLNAVRHRHRELRRRLQAKATKSAQRLLKKRRRKEARFAADTNHVIAKRIVTEAQRTGHGIALEDLQSIRDRVRLRKPQRVTLHSWSFHQLGGFITYKARRAGVAVIHVDPAYTSRQCSACGHTDRHNRPSQATFSCTSCGFAEHADVNAARNIATRGVADWAVSHAADDAA